MTTLKTLDELTSEWRTDGISLSSSDLLIAQAAIINLHTKYSDWLSQYVFAARKAQKTYDQMRLLRLRYYRGDLNADTELLTKLGWTPLNKKIDSTLVKDYLQGDAILTKMKLEIEELEELADKCKRVISALQAKGFAIQSSIKFKMFLHDGSE